MMALVHRWGLAAAVIISLAISLLRAAFLNNTHAGLVLAAGLQILLPGFLLLRAFGLFDRSHPLVRFVAVLAAGLGLTIFLGGLARFFQVPIPAYLLLLHALMLILALLRPAVGASTGSEPYRFTRQELPLYGLILACCLSLSIAAHWRSGLHYDSFEDPTFYAWQINWLATTPADPTYITPMTAHPVETQRAARDQLDGWTYLHAVWVWSSGINGGEFIWHLVTPLFIWLLPLITFAIAYQVTGRTAAGAWSAAAFTLFGLMTLDNIIYLPSSTLIFGRTLTYISTVRNASTALVLPLTLFAVLWYLHKPDWRKLAIVFLAGQALAMMRVRQITSLELSAGATLALWWLAQPTRRRLLEAGLLAVVLASFVILPYVLYIQPLVIQGNVYTTGTGGGAVVTSQGLLASARPDGRIYTLEGMYLRVVENVPLVGTTFVFDPASWFYHPFIALAAIIGLFSLAVWRRSLAAQYLFASTVPPLLIAFTPGISALMVRVVGSVAAANLIGGFFFVMPVALAIGWAADGAIRQVRIRGHAVEWAAAAIAAAAMFLLLFEPVPIPASARDQITAINLAQVGRDTLPADRSLAAALPPLLMANSESRVVLVSGTRYTPYLIEAIPGLFITGGRSGGNPFFAPTRRFMDEAPTVAPWLDSADLEFLTDSGATHIIMKADQPRVTQLRLQPERFQLLAAADGFLIFRIQGNLNPTPSDDTFARMNSLYADVSSPRWEPGGFRLSRSPAADWMPLAAIWAERLEADPANVLARYGLAISLTLAGRDADALLHWQPLYDAHPDTPAFIDGLAQVQQYRGLPQQALPVLLTALDSDQQTVRVLAARSLLTDTFFHLLAPDTLDRLVAVVEANPAAWSLLADYAQPEQTRDRAALLLSVGRWETAARWLNRMETLRFSPQDMLTLASAALVQGQVDAALTILEPTTDADWITPRRYMHPDRWERERNIAAQTYYLLLGEIASRQAHWDEAAVRFQQAIDWGSTWAGRYFLAQTWAASGQTERSAPLMATVQSEWAQTHPGAGPLNLVSLLTIADTRSVYVSSPLITQADTRLSLEATFINPNPYESYPIQSWRVLVASPDAATVFADQRIPAEFMPGAGLRLALPLDITTDSTPLIAARVFIEPRYQNTLTFGPLVIDLRLNRPASVPIPAAAATLARRFGDAITLRAASLDQTGQALTLNLYWEADEPIAADYQVFVHIRSADGSIALQNDTVPAAGRYPTSQWPTDTVIEDAHRFSLTELPPGTYQVWIGLYRLADFTRLPITPGDERAQNDSLLLFEFDRLATAQPPAETQ